MSVKPLLDLCHALERDETISPEQVEIVETRVMRTCPAYLYQSIRDIAKAATRLVRCRRRGQSDCAYVSSMRAHRRHLEKLVATPRAG